MMEVSLLWSSFSQYVNTHIHTCNSYSNDLNCILIKPRQGSGENKGGKIFLDYVRKNTEAGMHRLMEASVLHDLIFQGVCRPSF